MARPDEMVPGSSARVRTQAAGSSVVNGADGGQPTRHQYGPNSAPRVAIAYQLLVQTVATGANPRNE